MAFQISPGIAENDLPDWLIAAGRRYGIFADGRVNYTQADIAPVIMCTVTCQGEILLVKRGHGLADANGYWSIISGFIDDPKPVARQAAQELFEELGLSVKPKQIVVRTSYTLANPQEKRRYIIFPCLLQLPAKPKITLNEEHTDYAWATRQQLNDYQTLEDLGYAIDTALGVSPKPDA